MRTMLSIDDHVLAEAKRWARERGQTLGEVIEAALRRHLATSITTEPVPPVPVFPGGGGARPGIDLTSNRALHEALDDELPLDRRR